MKTHPLFSQFFAIPPLVRFPGSGNAWLVLILFGALFEPALAADAGGMPWEAPLTKLLESIKWASFVIASIAMVVLAIMIAWGGEINDWAKRMVMIILAISVVTGVGSLMTQMFGANSAVI